MDAGDFFAGAEAMRAIARAAKVTRTAVSVYAYDGPESAKVAGCGACAEACAFVHTLAWGAQTCRRNREKNARMALRRGRPVPFLCHMGFACVAAPLGPGEAAHVVTFGPYCPAETPGSLERDALEGLARMEQLERQELPFILTDIPLVHAEVVPEAAEWLNETLLEQLRANVLTPRVTDALDTKLSGTPKKQRVDRQGRAVRDPFGAHAIFAALANPESETAREVIVQQLTGVPGRVTPEKLRARAAAIVVAVIEAAGEAGRPWGAALTRGEGPSSPERLGGELSVVATVREATSAVIRALGPLRRAVLAGTGESGRFFLEFEAYVDRRIAQSLTLDAAAKHFTLPPSTLTRRLQRRYRVTFTGYLARRRVERAKTLLGSSALSVDTVAKRVGLTDGAHLRKLMRRFEGTTPTGQRTAGR